MSRLFRLALPFLLGLAACSPGTSEPPPEPAAAARLVPIADGWAKTSINVVIFRKHALTTHGDTQFVAFYDEARRMVLAKRALVDTTWTIHATRYTGNVEDAHNSISIAVDGDGYLHVAWDHHNHPLRYARSVRPGGLVLSDKLPMTGYREERVTYPEFYHLPDGNLLFLYRDGSSGDGDLMIKHYDLATRTWSLVQDALLSGEGERNAYWQFATDPQGAFHLSWVWRETSDVATNHDLGYAASTDGGRTWQRSDGTPYTLPITEANAEYARRIPQQSSLINQTSMVADAEGRPYIATYWTPAGDSIPQYHLVFHDGTAWQTQQVSRRTQPFTLGGGGTRRIPMSRPQLMVDARGGARRAYLVFRDAERGERVSVARCDDLGRGSWSTLDLTAEPVGAWEPTYDLALWERDYALHLLHQRVAQPDGGVRASGLPDLPPQPVSVLEWTP